MTSDQNFDQLERAVLYEDDDLIVINKPAGWVVNRSATFRDSTIQDWMIARLHIQPRSQEQESVTESDEDDLSTQYGTPETIFNERNGIVHRLDKDTSGVLLLAKNPVSLSKLLLQFKARQIEKTYSALVHGKIATKKGEIRLPISRSTIDRKRFAVDSNGRESVTLFEVLEYFPQLPTGIYEKKGHPYQGFSLVSLYPKTGRTHQIRVHMAAITHPLVADPVYCPRKKYTIDQEWCPRIFLHARQISCTHPKTGQPLTFIAPLPEDLLGAVHRLQSTSE